MKIDRRLQQKESRARLNTGARTGHAQDFSKNAKLGGVVLFVQTHSSTSIQSVNRIIIPVKIDRRQQQEETSALLKTGDQCTHDTY